VKLIVIIPALNEEKTIGRVLDDIPAAIAGVDLIEKIVVDDGSSDRTSDEARAHGAKVVRHPGNRGVGAAFSTGIKSALESGADLIVNMDGDGQFNPADIPALIAPLLAGTAEFATCTRFGDPALIPVMPAVKFWGNQWMVRIINFITRNTFTDVSCGFRAYTRETALRLNLFGEFTYTQETFLDLAQKRVRMVEVPLKVRGEREFGKSRVASSIPRYAVRAGTIILLALRDSKPLDFFGWIGVSVMSLGIVSGLIVFIKWVFTLRTYPITSLLWLGTLLTMVGLLLIVLALVADMLGRIKKNQDEVLYLLKKQASEKGAEQGRKPGA
jgi:glycosyltransferase involved in cell wall biosynthesis